MATRKANGTKVSAKEKKKVIMQAHGWTEEQYRKKYDIFKNKLRAYENFRRAHGINVKTQSPQQVLYRQARNMQLYGKDYRPSPQLKRIEEFTAVSITKGKKLARDFTSEYSKRRVEEISYSSLMSFEPLIRDVAMAQYIVYGKPLTTQSDKDKIKKRLGFSEGVTLSIGGNKVYVNGEALEGVEIIGDTIYEDGRKLWDIEPITDPVQREEALKDLAEHIHAKQKPSGEIASGETFGSDPLGDDYNIDKWDI